jgi:cytochrome bd-type quinol oxidase subunit 1
MRPSFKDLLLVFGILVAIVVTLTTLAYGDQSASLPKVEHPLKKAAVEKSATDILRKTLDRVHR